MWEVSSWVSFLFFCSSYSRNLYNFYALEHFNYHISRGRQYFSATCRNKRETESYVEIAESLGVDYPSKIIFVTDIYEEATAAKAAGLDVIISIRSGNGPLSENHGFQTIKSFSEI